MNIEKNQLLAIREKCMELVRSIDGAISSAESEKKANVDENNIHNVVDDSSQFTFEVPASALKEGDRFILHKVIYLCTGRKYIAGKIEWVVGVYLDKEEYFLPNDTVKVKKEVAYRG